MQDLERIVKEKFVGALVGEAHDFYCYLRCYGRLGYYVYSYAELEIHFTRWFQSSRRGEYAGIVRRKHRREYGPGKFWASSQAGWYLNKNFVKGWGGVNPVRP